MRQPGPIAGFYQRVKARRGHSIAIVASARKLACLFWCLLTRGEDYAFAQPSLTKKKMRRLELQAGAPRSQGGRGVWSTNEAMRQAERELALQAQRAYERTVKDWQQNKGASATPGRASHGSSKEHVARQTSRPNLRFDSSSPAPDQTLPRQEAHDQPHLTFIRRPKRAVASQRAAVRLLLVPKRQSRAQPQGSGCRLIRVGGAGTQVHGV